MVVLYKHMEKVAGIKLGMKHILFVYLYLQVKSPVCLSCGPPPDLTKHGIVLLSATEELASYGCDSPGFQLVDGDTQMVCSTGNQWTSNGTWGFLGFCDIVPCGDPPTPESLSIQSSTGSGADEVVQYQCVDGLYLEQGDVMAECIDGVWTWKPSGQPGVCVTEMPTTLSTTIETSSKTSLNEDTGVTVVTTATEAKTLTDKSSTLEEDATSTSFTSASLYTNKESTQPPMTTQHVAVEDSSIQPTKTTPTLEEYELPPQFSDRAKSKKICPPLRKLAHTRLVEYIPIVDGFATFECLPGYYFDDNTKRRTILCDQNAAWHVDTNLVCNRVQRCAPLSSLTSAACDSDVTLVDSVVRCRCPEDKYFLGGLHEVEVRCTHRFQWSLTPGHCMERCLPLSNLENGYLSSLYIDLPGLTVNVTCHHGYRFSDNSAEKTVTCGQGGTWEDVGRCQVITCPPLIPPSHAVLSSPDRTYGTEVNVTCDSGFYFDKDLQSVSLTCLEDGTWNRSSVVNQCIAVSCPDLSPVSNALQIGNATSYRSRVTFSCVSVSIEGDAARHRDGERELTVECLQTGHWSSQDISCEYGRCDPIPTVQYASPDNRLATENNHVTYTCDPGYSFTGGTWSQVVTCSAGVWNITQVECQEVRCPYIPILHYSSVLPRNISGEVLSLVCPRGHRFNVEPPLAILTVTCSIEGEWRVVDPDEQTVQLPDTCIPLRCDPIPDIEFSTIAVVDHADEYQSTVNITCQSGYWFGQDLFTTEVTCTENAHWEIVPSACKEILCPPLPTWSNLVLNDTARSIGAAIKVSCTGDQKGHVVTSGQESVCSSLGIWTPEVKPCTEKEVRPESSPVEAKRAAAIGAVGAVMVTVPVILLISMDCISLLRGLDYRKALT